VQERFSPSVQAFHYDDSWSMKNVQGSPLLFAILTVCLLSGVTGSLSSAHRGGLSQQAEPVWSGRNPTLLQPGQRIRRL